jgi:hypothetical protein
MALFDRMRTEIERRANMLPEEVNRWKKVADADAAKANNEKEVGKMGIHVSQLEALKAMMDGLQVRQTELLKMLKPELPVEQFANVYLTLSDEIVSMQEIWRIFRYIIALHKDEHLGPLVDVADLIAADCYLTCMGQMRDWKLVKEGDFRAPPLVYLEAEITPSTASRGFSADKVGFPLRRYRDMRLPIPLILLPADYASSMWRYSTLHHEVGHNLDQDLKLKDELVQHLFTKLDKETHPPNERQKMWYIQWPSEILADAFGVLLGGAGFVRGLVEWLFVLAPEERFQQMDTKAEHPPFYLRIHLLTEMLRCLEVPQLTAVANSIKQEWDQHKKPDWLGDYLAESTLAAGIFIKQPLEKLGNRALMNLVPDVADDVNRTRQLTDFLKNGLARPDPGLPNTARWRHVPAAAQMAFETLSNPDEKALGKIHDRAMGYLSDLHRPEKLAAADRTEFYHKLVRELKFS